MEGELTKEKKLLPVVFVKGNYNYHGQEDFKQRLLLQALQITTDPEKLKTMIGVKSVAQVYRTLDKMAIRKEYHKALENAGLTLDKILGDMKDIAENAENDDVKVKIYQGLLKSLGLDSYNEGIEEEGKTWEDVLLEHIDKRQIEEPKAKENEFQEYEVIEPDAPKEELENIAKEIEFGKSLYE